MSKNIDKSPWQIYILLCNNNAYYTGITTDLDRRLRQHNAGAAAAYTRAHGPVKLVYTEPQPSRSAALKREYQIKQLTHDEKKRLIS